MSEKKLHIHCNTDHDGVAHIDIPVGIAKQDIDFTIYYTAPLEQDLEQEDAELKAVLANAKPTIDMKQFCGVLEITEDPVEYQRRIRDEW